MGAPTRSAHGARNAPLADINVTPFVDVALVLLVIFMVTAPTLMKDIIGIQLPKAESASEKAPASLGIAVNRQGQILLNGQPVSVEGLKQEAAKALATNPDLQAILSADQDARHGDVVTAIDALKSSGLHRFAIQIRKE